MDAAGAGVEGLPPGLDCGPGRAHLLPEALNVGVVNVGAVHVFSRHQARGTAWAAWT
jgi:hypothetical protein